MAVYFDKKKVGVSNLLNQDDVIKGIISGNIEKLHVPEGTTRIKNYAFYEVEKLASISLPESIQTIGDHAFQYCSNLNSLVLPSAVTSIGASGLANTAITALDVPANVTCYGYAFASCSNLKTMHLGKNVTLGGSYVFKDCVSLETVTADNINTAIPAYTFYGCTALTKNPFDTAPTIGNYAFYNCTSLSNITLDKATTSIGRYSFSKCSSVSTITLPYTLTEIPAGAFKDCSNVTEIKIKPHPLGVVKVIPLANVSAFEGLNENFVIKVPNLAYKQAYIAATNWSTYADRITL
jgi:hypothetical protein